MSRPGLRKSVNPLLPDDEPITFHTSFSPMPQLRNNLDLVHQNSKFGSPPQQQQTLQSLQQQQQNSPPQLSYSRAIPKLQSIQQALPPSRSLPGNGYDSRKHLLHHSPPTTFRPPSLSSMSLGPTPASLIKASLPNMRKPIPVIQPLSSSSLPLPITTLPPKKAPLFAHQALNSALSLESSSKNSSNNNVQKETLEPPSFLTNTSRPPPSQPPPVLTQNQPLLFNPIITSSLYKDWLEALFLALERPEVRSLCQADKHDITVICESERSSGLDADFAYVPLEHSDRNGGWGGMSRGGENGGLLAQIYTVTNEGSASVFCRAILAPQRAQFTLTTYHNEPVPEYTLLKPGERVYYKINCKPQTREGMIMNWLVLVFEETSFEEQNCFDFVSHSFVIARRNLAVNIRPEYMTVLSHESKAFHPQHMRTLFHSSAKHQLLARTIQLPLNFFAVDEYLLGDMTFEAFWSRVVARSRATKALQQNLTSCFMDEYEVTLRSLSANSGLAELPIYARQAYQHLCVLTCCLFAEEYQVEQDMNEYTMFEVQLKTLEQCNVPSPSVLLEHNDVENIFLCLEVPGVAERKPTVSIGDIVSLRLSSAPEEVELSCCVCGVQLKTVILTFPVQYLWHLAGGMIGQEHMPAFLESITFHIRFHRQKFRFDMMHYVLSKLRQQLLDRDLSCLRYLWPSAHTPSDHENSPPSNPSFSRSATPSNPSFVRQATPDPYSSPLSPPPFTSSTLLTSRGIIGSVRGNGGPLTASASSASSLSFLSALNISEAKSKSDNDSSHGRGNRQASTNSSNNGLDEIASTTATADATTAATVISTSSPIPTDVPIQITPLQPQLNAEQIGAVNNIVNLPRASLPYVLFGPPGTGKTLTVVEAILQVRSPENRVLVCAPSDFAADVLVKRLAPFLSPTEMIRVCSYQRHTAVFPEVQPYCHRDSTGLYSLPSVSQFIQCEVLVCTCIVAGSVLLLPPAFGAGKRFGHIFFDESCQALEPEMMVPLQLAEEDTKVILAGDPNQLGAVVHSSVGMKQGLEMSLQERLSESLPPSALSQFIRNYRAHSKLLHLTSTLFYGGTLQPHADMGTVNDLTQWELLSNKRDFPLMFVGLVGSDFYEPESASFFNPLEALQVVEMVANLVSTTNTPLSDIGVIAPFRHQVIKIRQLLRARRLGAIRVDGVDDFQGQEIKVIFISAVISRKRRGMLVTTESGQQQFAPLGLLGNSKRFNVALSRAKALCVVVGNPNLLMKEPNFKALLEYCVTNDAYTGCPCPLGSPVLGAGYLQRNLEDVDEGGAGLSVLHPARWRV